MRRQAVRYVILSQLIFIATLLACVAVLPDILLNNQALSFYGSTASTAIIFGSGLLAMSLCLFRAAKLLPYSQPGNRTLATLFYCIAGLTAGLVFTPLAVNDLLYVSHFAIAATFGIVNAVTGYWLVSRSQPDPVNYMLFAIEIIAGILCGLSTVEIGLLNIMASCQLIAIFAFAGLVIRTLPAIEHVEAKV